MYKSSLKLVMSLFLCFSILITNIQIVQSSTEGPTTYLMDDAFVNSARPNDVLNNTTYGKPTKLIIGKGRHSYMRFDLSSIDTPSSNIEDISIIFSFTKSHDKNEFVFTECEENLQTTSTKWNYDNITYNNRPNDIEGAPVVMYTDTRTSGDHAVSVDLSTIFRYALEQGRKEVNIHLTTSQVDDNTVNASEIYSSRSTTFPGPSLEVITDESEVPVEPTGKDMGSYLNNSKVASKIFKMKNSDGKYIKVNDTTDTGSLQLTSESNDASVFALYAYDYYASVRDFDKTAPLGVTKKNWVIKCIDNNKYLSIQNYYTKEEFTSQTHKYFNIISGSGSTRVFEIKAVADMPNWNERFYIDYFAQAGYYRIYSHLATMRDDSGFAISDVRMTDTSMQSTSQNKNEYRFYFEDVTGKDLLEVCQDVAGNEAILFWNPMYGDINPANYSVTGADTSVSYTDGRLSAVISDLNAGIYGFKVSYNGGDYQLETDVSVRIFNHPGILHTEEELERMREHVKNREEPWYSDYLRLMNSVPYNYSSSNYEPEAQEGVSRSTGGLYDQSSIGYLERAGNVVYFNTLLWVATDDEKYAEAAVKNLNAWAHKLKIIDGRDSILGAGINGYKFACAAEILRYYHGGYDGYKDEDFKALQDMMENVVYPVIQDAGVPLLANGNWDTAALISMISIGVLCDNTDIFDRAMALYQDIHINGSIFSYVSETGQSQEGGRDQAHAQLGIGYMAEICQVAYNQDMDLYSLYDNRLAKAFEWAAKYNLYEDDVPFTPIMNVFNDSGRGYYNYLDKEVLNRGELRPVYEQPLAYYSKIDGVDMTWTAKAAESMRAQGYVHNDNLNFGTLTSYNGDETEICEPYFQLRTRREPLYQRNWVTVNGQRKAETVNSYYDVNGSGQLSTIKTKKDAPFYQLIDNRDGTYSIRLVKANTYLTVTDELVDGQNIIKADASVIGENEKFIFLSNGVGSCVLASPKYGNRVVYQNVVGSALNDSVYTLRLGAKTIADDPLFDMQARFIFMYNTESTALKDSDLGFTTRINAKDFVSSTGNIYIKSNGDTVPGLGVELASALNLTSLSAGVNDIVLTDAESNSFVDFSDPIAWDLYRTGSGSITNTIPEGQDTATWKVTVPEAGVYQLGFRYNNPATRVKGYRNDRDERNCRIIINDPDPASNFSKDDKNNPYFVGWMIFNISGYNDDYDPATNMSLTPQTDNNYKNVVGNTAWNKNYMNVYLDKGENTITLGIQAPPGQGVYDGPNLDYIDVTYVGDKFATEDEIPYLDEDFVFQHPGINFTLEDLENIKANKDDMDTVYGKGYAEVKTTLANRCDNYIHPPVTEINVGPYNNPNIGGTQFIRDAAKAYYNAFDWYMTGDVNRAKNAIAVLNEWSTSLTTVDPRNDLKLSFALDGGGFVNAAEILKHLYNNDPSVSEEDKWQEADIDKFEFFLRDKLLKTTMDYYPQANGNWDATIGGFNMSVAVFLDDVNLYNSALKQMYLGNIRGDYTVSMGCLPSYIYTTGEQQESSRDQVHSRIGLTGFAVQADISWNQGIDLYEAYDQRLMRGMNYIAKYLTGVKVESETFISDKNLQKNSWSFGFEIIGNHYDNQEPSKNVDTALVYDAAEKTLRNGTGYDRDSARPVSYFAAMTYTDKFYEVSMELNADKTTLRSIGDKIVITADVQTDSSIKSVNWNIPKALKPYVDYIGNGNGTLELELKAIPENAVVGTVKATSVKNAGVSDDIIITINGIHDPGEPDTIVNIAEIIGVTKPVTGDAPVLTIADTEQYTGRVSWEPDHSLFQASTPYTATITLTPKSGFTLTGIESDYFKVAGADATNSADSGVITAIFPMTEASTTPGAITVTSVTVTPGAITLDRGDTQSFTALVEGNKNPSQVVEWTVEGNLSAQTQVTSGGALTISMDETATTIIVKAASTLKGYTDKFGIATITVNQPPQTAVVIVVSEGTGATGSGSYATGEQVFIYAGTPPVGKQFSQWTASQEVVFGDKYSMSTSFTMPSSHVTVTAIFVVDNSNNSPSTPLSSSEQPDSAISGSVITPKTVVSGGVTTVNVSSADARTALVNARAEAVKNGSTPVVAVRISAAKSADSVSVTLAKAGIAILADSRVASLMVESGNVNIIFSSSVLNTIAREADGDVTISVKKGVSAALTEAQAAVVGGQLAYDLSMTSNGKEIKEFMSDVTVSLPYTLTKGENPNAVVVYYVDAKGNLQIIKNGVYDPTTKLVRFTTTHFSVYLVKHNYVTFSDIQGHWAKEAIEFNASRLLVSGVGRGKYLPDRSITRAEFIQMVQSVLNLPEGSGDVYDDVAKNTWYYKAVAAAKAAGLLEGLEISGSSFLPNQPILREEMAVILANAVIYKEIETPDSDDMSTFKDYENISHEYMEKLQIAINNGLMNPEGVGGGRFDPKGIATRAQAAQVQKNLLNLMK